MKVLSIDLDYIMFPTEHLFGGTAWSNNPMPRWQMFYHRLEYSEEDLFYDESRLHYLKNIFKSSIKKCKNVKFGYEHDDIIYYLKDCTKIDLINIDHHNDFIMGDYDFYDDDCSENPDLDNINLEYYHIVKFDKVDEGSWIGWLNAKGKLNSLKWIGNNNSVNEVTNEFIKSSLKDYKFITNMDYDFGDYEFDLIFVCLSPQYIPPHHWGVINWFIDKYEAKYHEKVNLRELETRKIEIDYRYKGVTNEILHQRTNDRESISSSWL